MTAAENRGSRPLREAREDIPDAEGFLLPP